jgi:hypothetical protein
MKTCGAAIGLGGGIASAVAATMLTVIVWATHSGRHGSLLQGCCTILFFLMIPLLAFGAHCLDLLDSPQQRNSRGGLGSREHSGGRTQTFHHRQGTQD